MKRKKKNVIVIFNFLCHPVHHSVSGKLYSLAQKPDVLKKKYILTLTVFLCFVEMICSCTLKKKIVLFLKQNHERQKLTSCCSKSFMLCSRLYGVWTLWQNFKIQRVIINFFSFFFFFGAQQAFSFNVRLFVLTESTKRKKEKAQFVKKKKKNQQLCGRRIRLSN